MEKGCNLQSHPCSKDTLYRAVNIMMKDSREDCSAFCLCFSTWLWSSNQYTMVHLFSQLWISLNFSWLGLHLFVLSENYYHWEFYQKPFWVFYLLDTDMSSRISLITLKPESPCLEITNALYMLDSGVNLLYWDKQSSSKIVLLLYVL